MKRMLAAGGLAILSGVLTYGQPGGAMPLASERALVDKYCIGCHNDKLKTGGFTWSSIDLAHPDQNAEQAEKVIQKLRAGMMPPASMPRPDDAAIKSLAGTIEASIDRVAAAHPNPGRHALYRLNRTEYANSIRDLLGIDVDKAATVLPADDMSHGFDNISDVLTISPALMDGYIRAAGQISRMAVGDPKVTPAMVIYRLPRIFSQTRHVPDTPFGTRGGISVVHNFPADGEYIFRMTFYYSGLGVFFGQLEKGHQIEVAVNGERVALLDINPFMKLNDDLLTVPVKVKAGPQRISASFLQKADGPLQDNLMPIEQSLVDVSNANVAGLTSLPHLHDLGIKGPYNVTGVSETPSRQKIFICRPASASEEASCAKKILSKLAQQAYRRPVGNEDTEELLNFFQLGRNKGGSFDAGIRAALEGILANPQFVFRFERPPANVAPGANYRISDLELASRLSYFLWSSAPDDPLITLASRGKLHDPAILEAQVRRMLSDPRAESLATNFASHWLHLQDIKDIRPDDYLYPNFDENLRQAMIHETESLFSNVVREDRNILDLLTANYTFVDEQLAKHYGIPDVLGNRFRRVTITDPNRFGLLGQGSILTLTSQANRTSPVRRGKWVMDVLLGTPPPPPPPNVPPLKENTEGAKVLSVRERMEQHRSVEPCASCHKLMDPIGFALDNFDPLGVWRIKDSGFVVEPVGQMFDGSKLDGPASLRQAIVKHSDQFVRNFTAELLMYGLGRVIDYYDMPVVRSIDRAVAGDDNRFSSIVLGIVKSVPFQMRRAEEGATTDAAAKAHH